MDRMSGALAERTFILPWLARPPIGFVELSGLVREGESAAAAHG
jgi:arsenite-transporting ATPase